MNLEEANKIVLRAIAQGDNGIVLGFLPLSQTEEDSVLAVVREALPKYGNNEAALPWKYPAAVSYALAAAASKRLTSGGEFWPSLERELGLTISVPSRKSFSDRFRRICKSLGLLDGTITDAGWKLAAPFIFQAGILHHWKGTLANGLRTTLKHTPAPDLEDPLALRGFATRLIRHIHNQPNLKRILETDVGPLLVNRLVAAYARQDWSVLPPHLQEPIREAFSESGKDLLLRSPYLAFDTAFRQIQILLPAVSHRIASPDSYWRVDGRRYAARKETFIPVSELGSGRIVIELCQLLGSFEQQTFKIDTSLSGNVPFRIFRADNGRERKFANGEEIEIPPGNYVVLMADDVTTNDEDYVTKRDGFRELEIELRPGDDSLVLSRSEESWLLGPTLTRGVYVDRGRASVAILEDGDLLHYGSDLGLVAYFPSQENNGAPFSLSVRCSEQSLFHEEEVSVSAPPGRVYVFQDDLQLSLAAALAGLSPGIHRVEVSLAHPSGRIDHAFWYWKGLESISDHLGFSCRHSPENLKVSGSHGLIPHGTGFRFRDGYHAPTVTLSITKPTATLFLCRAGVRLTLGEPGDQWEEEPAPSKAIIVAPDDHRVLRCISGGFQPWEILGNGRVLTMLDQKRNSYLVSLAGLAEELGGAGRIQARTADGRVVPLMIFNKPLTSTPPRNSLDHANGTEVWKFKVALEKSTALGVAITELSEAPDATPCEMVTIAQDGPERPIFDECRFGAATIVVNAYSEDALESQTAEKINVVRVKVTILVEALESGLWSVDFFRRGQTDDSWIPLQSVEKHGYSKLRVFAWGDKMPVENAPWWPRLRRARRFDPGQIDPKLAESLKRMTLPELDRALQACRNFLGWKYPTAVWNANAHRVQDFPVHLGQHRFSITDESATIWWHHAALELSEHAAVQSTPVVRQFLFASQPTSLRIPRSRLKSFLDEATPASPVARCFNVAGEIQQAGSLKAWLVAAYGSGELNPDAIPCYSNFMMVHTGVEHDFRGFSLKTFLTGGEAGMAGLEAQTLKVSELQPRFEVTNLLGPEHLLYCIRGINRRCHSVYEATQYEAEHSLSQIAQTIERVAQRMEIQASSLAPKLGWRAINGDWWIPPLMENPCAEKVAGAIWMVAGISRLAASGGITHQEFHSMLNNLLCDGDDDERRIQNRLCILLSLGPELFSFYLVLFELALATESSP